MIPDLSRRWTVAEATSLLWTQGISLRLQADGYHLVDVRHGAPRSGDMQAEQIADDLIEALVLGLSMRSTLRMRPTNQPAAAVAGYPRERQGSEATTGRGSAVLSVIFGRGRNDENSIKSRN